MMYFGGKQRIAKQLASIINRIAICNNISTYVEPFCGACNIAERVNISKKILNDKHPYLIAMFKALQNGWIPPDDVSEELYTFVKNNKDIEPHLSGFVGFGCCFYSKFFRGYARGTYSNGKPRNYAFIAKQSLIKSMPLLMDAIFTCNDFIDLTFDNCLIYCDSPYKNTTPYSVSLLGKFPYDKYLDWCRMHSKNNIVLISEYKKNVPDDGIILIEINSSTCVRNKKNKHINTIEALYTFNQDLEWS